MNEEKIEELRRLCREAEDNFLNREKHNECLRSIGELIYEEAFYNGITIRNRDGGYEVTVEV